MHGQASAAAVLAAGGVAATLRWVGLAVDPGNAFVLVLGPTHGVTFGATHLSSVFLLASRSALDAGTGSVLAGDGMGWGDGCANRPRRVRLRIVGRPDLFSHGGRLKCRRAPPDPRRSEPQTRGSAATRRCFERRAAAPKIGMTSAELGL
jgi:hypothetical protein